MERLPLSALLSHALVAFTIELDNEFEHRMPHWTTSHGGTRHGPWLVSVVMYLNCMQFVGGDPVRLRDLERLARTKTNLDGMQRWGYVTVAPDPAGKNQKIVRATTAGGMAREVWRPLFGEIEKRWEDRFGRDAVDALRQSLAALAAHIDLDLPDCLPILKYGLRSDAPGRKKSAGTAAGLPLLTLLSRVLLAFAVEFERVPEISLAIGANVIRILDEDGVKVRDLPLLSGVSREAIAMTLGFLEKRGLIAIASNPKAARLTARGIVAQDGCRCLVDAVEQGWRERFGAEAIDHLRAALEHLSGGGGSQSPLFRGLDAHPEGWRASVRRPETLPHFPVVLHRGGFPDGS